jgi:LmbE family N-acetylglucosaminyl deacetylase
MSQSLQHAPILVVAAHPDDEVLGCGGTLARMAGEGRQVHILLLADGETSRASAAHSTPVTNRIATRKQAAHKACAILGCASVKLLAMPDNRMDSVDRLEVVQQIEELVQRHRPSTVLTHHASDVNIDHRVVHDAVVAACRPQPGHPVKRLLFFEVPSSTEWRPSGSAEPFNPNSFFDISATIATKLKALEAYGAELRPFPHPRSLQAVTALAHWRGASVGVPAAEAFVLGREIA